ncbi:ExeA family protein [Desulfoscipio gibsoniae]|uniref:Type II secretory pathway, component ExeA (Predicted ATPase) n=1 Tax=Desulfoscipio gibsoniae DSM 7213 TaxID=767817 RepID=R4KEL7_9FIRM|nr:AAA family ATPase [Desulfoscipio gibsoniae]AGL00117.1 type II secretory pathway, component ExeA (predicted ATPase) [Desulfoscipio gibsoniae DSM 7213]
MYKAFYSLAAAPFSKELKVSDAYVSTPHQEALGCLNYMKQVRGMGLFVGEPGAGKTYALRVFTDSLNKSLYKVVYFPLSTGSVNDFYRGLAFGLGEEPKNRKVDLFRQIQQTITVLFHERKVTPVFILDEMQMAKDVFLSDLNLLFNFQMDSHNPFILLLCGLPYLRDRMALNHNRPLAQRLLLSHHIEPLDKEEVKGYVLHHMTLAGAKHPIFTDAAFEAIAACTQGYPRLINKLGTHALLHGYMRKAEQIDAETIRIAAQENGM